MVSRFILKFPTSLDFCDRYVRQLLLLASLLLIQRLPIMGSRKCNQILLPITPVDKIFFFEKGWTQQYMAYPCR